MLKTWLVKGVSLETVGGAGYRCGILARGIACGVIQGNFDFHDVGPCSLLIEEAGGRVSDLNGQKLKFDKQTEGGIILSNGTSHDDIVASLTP